MPHFHYDEKSRAQKTPREWLTAGKSIGDFVNRRSQREDIIAFVGEGAGSGAAAAFNPALAEIELDVSKAFVEGVKPAWVGDFEDRTTLFDFPRAAGALIHEAGHARWTLWSLLEMHEYRMKKGPDQSKRVKIAGIVEFMEESRIEKLAADTWPDDRAFLRTSALEIVMEDINLDELKDGQPYAMSRLLLLTAARADAGVLDYGDVEELVTLVKSAFGEDLYGKLRALWLKSQAVRDHVNGFKLMLPLAEEWVDLLPEEADDDLPQELKDMLQQIADMMADAQENAEIGGNEDAMDQEETERTAKQVEAQNAQAREKKDHKETAEKVFAKSTEETDDWTTDSRITDRRQPSGPERAAMVKLAKDLERAKYTDRIRIDTRTVVPPGRLHTRDAVQGMAQRATGGKVTAQPWERTIRRHTEDPNLTIGFMSDVSGSMNSAMTPMAVAGWGMTEAGHRIQAKIAAVCYGNNVFPTLKVGQRQTEIITRYAGDGTERFDMAFKALNGELQLLDGNGARLLVISSDLCYTYHERIAVKTWTDRCVRAGVGVVILSFGGTYDIESCDLNPAVQVIGGRLSTQDTLAKVGAAAVRGLAAVNGARG